MNKIATLGIDLAKNVFQLHGVDSTGKAVLRREVRRAQLMKAIAQLEPCLIGITTIEDTHPTEDSIFRIALTPPIS